MTTSRALPALPLFQSLEQDLQIQPRASLKQCVEWIAFHMPPLAEHDSAQMCRPPPADYADKRNFTRVQQAAILTAERRLMWSLKNRRLSAYGYPEYERFSSWPTSVPKRRLAAEDARLIGVFFIRRCWLDLYARHLKFSRRRVRVESETIVRVDVLQAVYRDVFVPTAELLRRFPLPREALNPAVRRFIKEHEAAPPG